VTACQANLSSQLWPPKTTSANCPKNSPRGVLWGGSGHGHGQKKGQDRSLFYFFAQFFFGEIDVRRIDVPPREARLRLGSVAAALVNFLQQLNPGYVYKHIEKLDTVERAYGWLHSMASSSESGVQIRALCAESFCKRILCEANNVCHD